MREGVVHQTLDVCGDVGTNEQPPSSLEFHPKTNFPGLYIRISLSQNPDHVARTCSSPARKYISGYIIGVPMYIESTRAK